MSGIGNGNFPKLEEVAETATPTNCFYVADKSLSVSLIKSRVGGRAFICVLCFALLNCVPSCLRTGPHQNSG